MPGMTINEALKTRALVQKRIDNAEARLVENAAHTSLSKPVLGKEQAEILKRTLQSVKDLRDYRARLHAAIHKANLETLVEVKGLGKVTLHSALEMRGHGARESGSLDEDMRLWKNIQHRIRAAAQEAEHVVRSMPKDVQNVEAITHIDPKKAENEIARLTQLRHDLDVAIEATNFTTFVELDSLPPEEQVQ